MIDNHLSFDDHTFEAAFNSATLPPSLFNHEAHLRLAWIHIQQYGLDTAIENICSQLLNYVDHHGARDKYNETLTIAAIKAVYHFINRSDDTQFSDFIHSFPRLKYQFMELMNAHYSFDIFNAPKAKTQFLEPDLLPFD